jgi:hypothetical protein
VSCVGDSNRMFISSISPFIYCIYVSMFPPICRQLDTKSGNCQLPDVTRLSSDSLVARLLSIYLSFRCSLFPQSVIERLRLVIILLLVFLYLDYSLLVVTYCSISCMACNLVVDEKGRKDSRNIAAIDGESYQVRVYSALL